MHGTRNTRAVILLVDGKSERALALQQLVDDERLVFQIVTDAKTALLHLDSSQVGMVIANDALPGTDGVSLLETIRQRWPSTMRVIIADDLWPDLTQDAVNRGGVHKVLSRRMEPGQLKETIYELVSDLLASERITDEVTAVVKVPRHPAQSLPTPDPISVEGGPLLILLAGGGPGRIYSVTEEVVIGRDRRSTIWLPGSDVSRRHARVSRQPTGEVEIEDLDSRNGTRVNGALVGKATLRSGDTIDIGDSARLLFQAVGRDSLEPT